MGGDALSLPGGARHGWRRRHHRFPGGTGSPGAGLDATRRLGMVLSPGPGTAAPFPALRQGSVGVWLEYFASMVGAPASFAEASASPDRGKGAVHDSAAAAAEHDQSSNRGSVRLDASFADATAGSAC